MKTNWPVLKFEELKDTITTVQLWTQIVGKIRLAKTPWLNHSWHVTLYVSPDGLTTGSIPYDKGFFRIDFNFIKHHLLIVCSDGYQQQIELYPRTVADFYKELFDKLKLMGIDVTIYAKPNEVVPAIPFQEDETHFQYDKDQMHLFWRALVKIDTIFTRFRTGFTGKCSPVHLFWGAFDLAVTRFSGRKAPPYSGMAPNMSLTVMQEAYSHEVSSCGFWWGNDDFPYPAFYAYCYPAPESFGEQKVEPKEAFFSKEMGEFLLKYEDVIHADDPEKFLMAFLQSTYEAAANTGNWDRQALECNLAIFEKKAK